jgi:hypothetical protein
MARFARPSLAAVVLFSGLGFASPVDAQSIAALPPTAAVDATPPPVLMPPLSVLSESASSVRRPSALVPLYISFAGLQLADVHSTSRALDRGAFEANPLMNAFAGNKASLIAVKAAGGAVAIYASEQLWKTNRTAAIAFMIATNSAMAWVVQHNYRAVR